MIHPFCVVLHQWRKTKKCDFTFQFLARCRGACSTMLLYCYTYEVKGYMNGRQRLMTTWNKYVQSPFYFIRLLLLLHAIQVLHMSFVVCLHCADLAAKIIVNLSRPLQNEKCDSNTTVTGGKEVHRCFSSKQGKHRIICGHQCLVVTWSFMDQLFSFLV